MCVNLVLFYSVITLWLTRTIYIMQVRNYWRGTLSLVNEGKRILNIPINNHDDNNNLNVGHVKYSVASEC